MNSDDLLMTCSGCGAEAVVHPGNWEAQRSFRAEHKPPCVHGSGGKPWPKKRWVSDRRYEIGNEATP